MLDIQQAAYKDDMIDRHILQASDSVDELCKRVFYVTLTTRKWDWPNFQFAVPWRIWLDASEIADIVTNPPQVTSGGQPIPNTAIFWGPWNYAPPFRFLELDRSQSYAFGVGSTPQQDVQILADFGYWQKLWPAGSLGAAVTASDQVVIQLSTGLAGVGDTLYIGSERVIVTDRNFVTMNQTQQGAGCSTASNADNQLSVTDGTQFSVGDSLLLDAEMMKVLAIAGNTLIVKRGWDGTVLAAHTAAMIYAARLYTVLRGQLGTAPATYTTGTAVSGLVIPGLVKELAVAEAAYGVIQDPAGWPSPMIATAWQMGKAQMPGEQQEPMPGVGLPDLRKRCEKAYGRQMRVRVV